jgi:hypothetical protein
MISELKGEIFSKGLNELHKINQLLLSQKNFESVMSLQKPGDLSFRKSNS